jgi:hypothetical protein
MSDVREKDIKAIISYRNKYTRCDNCGKFVSPKDYDNGASKSKIDDCHWEILCKKCNIANTNKN